MVNLFSFGCHVTDQACVRTYASTDCTGRVGETIKRKGGVSQVCLGKPLSFILAVHNMVNWQLSKQDSHWPVSHGHIEGSCVNSWRWRDLFGSCPLTSCFTRSQSMLIWEHRKTDNAHINWTSMLWSINSCQNRVSADQYHLSVSRAQVSTHRSQVFFFKLSASKLLIFKWLQAQVQFF